MRILLAIASNRTRNELTGALEAEAQEVVTSNSRGEELLQAIEGAKPVHALLLAQAALGGEWARLLRQLRRRVPDARTVILLSPGAEQHWRRAMMAGAFEVLPGSSPVEALLEAVRRAVASTAAHPAPQAAARRERSSRAGRSKGPMAPRDALGHRHAP